MRISLISARELTDDLLVRWSEIQSGSPALASPYFSPEFNRAVADVRDDVEVALIHDGESVVAFFPFQRSSRTVGIPVGGILSDYHGLICQPGFACDPLELMHACGLVTWNFDHLLASQTTFARFHQSRTRSPLIDLSGSVEAYLKAIPINRELDRCERKLGQEIGPLRFQIQLTDEKYFDALAALKSAQFQRTGQPDLFSVESVRSVVRRIFMQRTESFAGMLSGLFAGDTLVAAHMGMRSKSVWHYWFPAYDRAFSKFSPGMILLRKMVEAAPGLQIRALDLGKGESQYKSRFANGEVAIAEGSVELRRLRRLQSSAHRTLRRVVINSPFAGSAKRLVSWARGGSGGGKSESAGRRASERAEPR